MHRASSLDNKGATLFVFISVYFTCDMHCALKKSALYISSMRSNILLLEKFLGHYILRKVRINSRNKHLNLIYICLWMNLYLKLMSIHQLFRILITNTSIKLMNSLCQNRALKSLLFFLLKQYFHFFHFIFWINSITMRLMQKTDLSNFSRILEK